MHFYFDYKRDKDNAEQIQPSEFTKKRKRKKKVSLVGCSQISFIWTKSDPD